MFLQRKLQHILPGEFLLLHVLQLFCIAETGQGSRFIVCLAKHLKQREGVLVVLFTTTVRESSAWIAVELGVPVLALLKLLDQPSDFGDTASLRWRHGFDGVNQCILSIHCGWTLLLNQMKQLVHKGVTFI